MPLARYALYAQGVEIYVAPTYDSGDGWLATMRHIALEGRCWVVGSGTALRAADIAQDFPARATLFPDAEEWVNDGDSVVVDPAGKVVAGPLRREIGIPTRIRDLGGRAEQLPEFARKAFAIKRLMQLTPRTVSEEAILELYQAAL